jgi:hypothetical protein
MDEKSGVSDEQLLEGLALLRESLPRVLNPSEVLTPVESLALNKCVDELGMLPPEQLAGMVGVAVSRATEARAALIIALEVAKRALKEGGEIREQLLEFGLAITTELVASATAATERARVAANRRHDLPGGAREKQRLVREAWASGKYTSRERCAEEEAAALGMSFAAARKALRNTPDPA